MDSTFAATDKVVKAYLLQIVRLFRKLQRKALVFDELNILAATSETYTQVDALCKEAFAVIAKRVYRRKRGEDFPIEMWLAEWLDEADPVTQFIWANEVERKRARLSEAILSHALAKKPKALARKDIETAMRLFSRQFGQTADDVTAAAAIKAYEDMGVKKVRWVTERDERVCEECAPLDGRVYDLEKHPQWPAHWNCRCELVPVG